MFHRLSPPFTVALLELVIIVLLVNGLPGQA